MPEPTTPRRRIVGVSTKMYFSATRTACFVTSVIDLLAAPLTTSSKRPALDEIDVFIVPDHVTLVGVIDQVRSAPAGTPASRIIVGAQDCSDKDFGAFTGEVSPAVLAEVGCGIVELGHAERRRLFGETDASAASKAAAVVRNRMVPLVCIPDQEEVVLAYEPVWAIGAAEPAGTGHLLDGIRQLIVVSGWPRI
ncbi:putative triosephosphate isomerase [Echria macrotheca]|uniref:Triosephosphate isomerase n=1 Tax=Echria macrotheca TaxID=438768 RepID=A0AAJ0BHD8_9PEZI|nr:putative triosephosphate isomerase [Echria macrotheca]